MPDPNPESRAHQQHIGEDWIHVKGARTHNLKNLSVSIPRGVMTVLTGLSGSGKSSLAFETIFAEGQRRYVESLSAYARQFLNQMQKPDVDEITGLSPAISIDQKSRSNNPRSTVATVTEIYDYLRVLYARAGQPYCINHDVPIVRLSKEEMIRMVWNRVQAKTGSAQAESDSSTEKVMGVEFDRTQVVVFAPVVVGRKGEYYQMLYDLLGKGYERVMVDGVEHSLREKIALDRNKRHDIDAIVDSIFVTEFVRNPDGARERLSEALELALKEADGLVKIRHADGTIETLSSKFICPEDGMSFPEVEPRLFSFNSPYGACPNCNGLGTKSLFSDEPCPVCHGKRLRPETLRVYLKSIPPEGSVKEAKKKVPAKDPKDTYGGDLGKNIVDFTSMSIRDAKNFMDGLHLSEFRAEVAAPIIREIVARLDFMLNVGLDYLTLNRSAATLSGGEAQRIRLASQLGTGLVGALYVLDEPTIGLHQRDNERLIKTLLTLKELGNTILVVEHDEDTIFAADYLVDIGPGAGTHGGNVVAAGWLDDLLTAPTNESGSETLAYLREEKEIEIPEERREGEKGSIKIKGATLHNLVNQNIDVPLGKLVGITGVSGSGKSTFLYDVLHKNVAARLAKREAPVVNAASVTGTEYIGRVVLIDQSAIGRTPRSNPATYTGAFTHIRDLFAASNEARARGWKPGRFSFNVAGGRCETCQGNGVIAVEMHFLPTVYVICDVCNGTRFMRETLEVTYKGKNIYDVLQMTIEEAEVFFKDIPAINDRLEALNATGLQYLTLGQSATTLSGGEAQRVKVASELYRPTTMKTLYLLDEPTVGLHYEDVRKLIEILQELVRRGNTVVVIEHNLDLVKSADYLIDFGPEGGIKGGKIMAKGTPEEVADTEGSFTGEYLAKLFAKAKKRKKGLEGKSK
ncbi:MAG: uvrA [Parcubacteria group bacterium]|nr:uvrA [Parcubacteria group bacterium]